MTPRPWRNSTLRSDRGSFIRISKSAGTPALAEGQEQVHKDDLHSVQMDSALDDLLPIQGNGQWHLKLTADPDTEEAQQHPDWYGYWKI